MAVTKLALQVQIEILFMREGGLDNDMLRRMFTPKNEIRGGQRGGIMKQNKEIHIFELHVVRSDLY